MKYKITAYFVVFFFTFIPTVIFSAEESCICNTNRGSGVLVPYYANQADCEVAESRTNPSDSEEVIYSCVWINVDAGATPDLPSVPDDLLSDPADDSQSTSDSPSGEIQSRLRSLNALNTNSTTVLIGTGIGFFTSFFGSIALVMIIYGGLQIMFAQGSGDKVKQGTKVIIWASIGLITMMLSYVLVNFVFSAIL